MDYLPADCSAELFRAVHQFYESAQNAETYIYAKRCPCFALDWATETEPRPGPSDPIVHGRMAVSSKFVKRQAHVSLSLNMYWVFWKGSILQVIESLQI